MIWAAPGKSIQSGACTALMVRRTRRPWLGSVVLTSGHVAPGQGLACGAQGRLVRLHGQNVVAAPAGDVTGGVPLAMHRICGDDGVGDVHAVQQVPQGGDLVAFGGHRELADHRARGLVERGHQVRGSGGGAGAADGLAVHGDDPPPGEVSNPGGHPSGQPGIQVVGVQQGQGAAHRGLRRQQLVRADSDAGQHVPVCVLGPLGDRQQGPGPGQHRSLGQREQCRQAVSHAAGIARVGHLCEHLHQLSTRQHSNGRR